MIDVAENIVGRLRGMVPADADWATWRISRAQRTLDDMRRELTQVTDAMTVAMMKAAKPNIILHWHPKRGQTFLIDNREHHPVEAWAYHPDVILSKPMSSYMQRTTFNAVRDVIDTAANKGRSSAIVEQPSLGLGMMRYTLKCHRASADEVIMRCTYEQVKR